jgi:GAF domain-containing protein
MHHPAPGSAEALRLLECWLPLAQRLNQRYGWNDDAQALERLIVLAAPALALCADADEAHLVLFIARGGVWQRRDG